MHLFKRSLLSGPVGTARLGQRLRTCWCTRERRPVPIGSCMFFLVVYARALTVRILLVKPSPFQERDAPYTPCDVTSEGTVKIIFLKHIYTRVYIHLARPSVTEERIRFTFIFFFSTSSFFASLAFSVSSPLRCNRSVTFFICSKNKNTREKKNKISRAPVSRQKPSRENRSSRPGGEAGSRPKRTAAPTQARCPSNNDRIRQHEKQLLLRGEGGGKNGKKKGEKDSL